MRDSELGVAARDTETHAPRDSIGTALFSITNALVKHVRMSACCTTPRVSKMAQNSSQVPVVAVPRVDSASEVTGYSAKQGALSTDAPRKSTRRDTRRASKGYKRNCACMSEGQVWAWTKKMLDRVTIFAGVSGQRDGRKCCTRNVPRPRHLIQRQHGSHDAQVEA